MDGFDALDSAQFLVLSQRWGVGFIGPFVLYFRGSGDLFILWEGFNAGGGVQLPVQELNATPVIYLTSDDSIARIYVSKAYGWLFDVLLDSHNFDGFGLFGKLCVVFHEGLVKRLADLFVHVLEPEVFQNFSEGQS